MRYPAGDPERRHKVVITQCARRLAWVLVMVLVACPGSARYAAGQAAPARPQPAAPADQQLDLDLPQQPGEAAAQPDKPAAAVPVLNIKRLDGEEQLYSIELRDVQLGDLFRVIAHDYSLNIMIDPKVSGTITASFTAISLDEALEAIAEMTHLTIDRKGKIIRVSPNVVTKTVVLRYIEARKLLEPAGTPGQSGSTGIMGLLSDKGRILLGQQQNSLTIIDNPDNVKKVEAYLAVADHKIEARVFKLKYLKADEIVGVTQTTLTKTETIGAEGTAATTTATTTQQK